jgi:hypothetical protein
MSFRVSCLKLSNTKKLTSHEIVVGLIGGKSLEVELFAAKLLQAAMGEFIGAALMMMEDQESSGDFLK